MAPGLMVSSSRNSAWLRAGINAHLLSKRMEIAHQAGRRKEDSKTGNLTHPFSDGDLPPYQR